MPDTIQWTIVALALVGFVFNSGVLWNEVRHLKKSVEDIWKKMDKIEQYLLERKSEKE